MPRITFISHFGNRVEIQVDSKQSLMQAAVDNGVWASASPVAGLTTGTRSEAVEARHSNPVTESVGGATVKRRDFFRPNAELWPWRSEMGSLLVHSLGALDRGRLVRR